MSGKRKAILIILDGVGIGALPDASLFGDENANTLKNISLAKPFNTPNLEALGLGNIEDIRGIKRTEKPKGFYGKMAELSSGKDSTTGHWEIAGIVTQKPFATFPEGFPAEMIERFLRDTGAKSILGNKAASGTKIIEELGEEHLRTGHPIVYTSADSVFQIAANKDIVSLERLYEMCEKARLICNDYNIGRVIARPFTGKTRLDFERTPQRRDYSLKPPKPFLLTNIQEAGMRVQGIGKIDNLFADVGVDDSPHTKDNHDGIHTLIDMSKNIKEGLIFINLIDFDMLYGHRRDVEGFHRALTEFDSHLPQIIDTLTDDNLMIITADHGTDPTTESTDHSREYVPLLAYSKSNEAGKNLGTRKTFADAGQTLSEFFGTEKLKNGKSFYGEIYRR